MDKSRPKVGLALGGGYARGLAHIGVLEVLEREGIPIDMIAGTSIGALVGALYARTQNAAQLKRQATQLDSVGVTSLVDFTLPKSGFISGKRVTNLLRKLIGDVQFKDLNLPLACIATDIISGEEVILDEGSELEAVRASISIPVVFTAVKKNGRYLVDGGLVNPVPVRTVQQMGADVVIAVDVTPDRMERANALTKKEEHKEPGIFQIMAQSIYIATYLAAQTSSGNADIVIRPHVAHIGPGDFHRGGEGVLEGELAAVDCLPNIKRHLAYAGISLTKRGA
jgi:NTE family protein